MHRVICCLQVDSSPFFGQNGNIFHVQWENYVNKHLFPVLMAWLHNDCIYNMEWFYSAFRLLVRGWENIKMRFDSSLCREYNYEAYKKQNETHAKTHEDAIRSKCSKLGHRSMLGHWTLLFYRCEWRRLCGFLHNIKFSRRTCKSLSKLALSIICRSLQLCVLTKNSLVTEKSRFECVRERKKNFLTYVFHSSFSSSFLLVPWGFPWPEWKMISLRIFQIRKRKKSRRDVKCLSVFCYATSYARKIIEFHAIRDNFSTFPKRVRKIWDLRWQKKNAWVIFTRNCLTASCRK